MNFESDFEDQILQEQTINFTNSLNLLKQQLSLHIPLPIPPAHYYQNNEDQQNQDDWVDEDEFNGDMGDYLSSEQEYQKLSQQDLQLIPLKNYQQIKDICDQDQSCSICFREYKETQQLSIRKLFCSHFFHQECLDPWILQKPNCPLCKLNIKQTL